MPDTDLLNLAFLQRQPRAAARILETFAAEQLVQFLQGIPLETLAPVIGSMAGWPAARILSKLPAGLAADLLRQLPDSDAETLLRLMGSEYLQPVMEKMPGYIARRFQRKLTYPVGTVGAWMDTGIPVFTDDTSVHHCLEQLRQNTSPLGGIVIVINSARKLMGLVEIENLLTADADNRLLNLLDADISPLSSRATLWEVEEHEGWIRFPTLPVVDLKGHVLGALTHAALRSGTAKNLHQDDLSKHSLITHMTRAFFVSLGGIIQVVAGVGQNESSITGPQEQADDQSEPEPRYE